MPQNYHLNLSFVKDRWKPGWWKYGQKLSWNSQLSIAIFSLVSHMVSKVSKLKQSVSSKSQCICIHKITIHYGLIRAIKLHNSFFLTLGYRIQMHVSTIPGNFNKLLTSKTTKASINEKIFMINKTQWGEFQCFFYRIVFCRYTGRGSSYFVIFGSKELSWNATIMNSEDWL